VLKFKYIVTSALPYVNNVPHLGTIVGCVLPADVYSRYLKLKGEECVYVCGTDEYGTPIAVQAEKEGISPKELCDKYYEIHKKVYEGFNIKFDVFSRTSSPEHTELTQYFYNKLKKKGHIYKKKVKQLYCPNCKRFLPDRYVIGTCPYCGYEKARGDQCESCGKVLEPSQLLDARCNICSNKPVLKETEHSFFRLSAFQRQLKEWIDKNKHWPANARSFALSWIREGLIDRSITRDLEWGVPCPDDPSKVIYVWFDAPIGYITFSKQIGKEDWWKDKKNRIVHFIGKDNIPFHAIIFPAMNMGVGEYILPYQIASAEYLNYEGGKFSKSEGRGVFGDDALKLFPADYWRYVLMSMYPENRDVDFTWEEFQRKVNTELNDAFGNFVYRVISFVLRFHGRELEKPEQFSEKDRQIVNKVKESCAKINKLYESIKLKEALQEIIALARLGNQYLNAEEPWKNKDRAQSVMFISLNIVKTIAILIEPFLPETSAKIKKALNIEDIAWHKAAELLEFGKVEAIEPLFRKVDDKEVIEYRQRFRSKVEGVRILDTVSYDDFKKMKLKVAEIVSVEDVAGADKLYKLSIDIGGEKRTLVAGLKGDYDKEELLGKKIIVLTNLEAKKIRGIESQGMLLAAEKGDKVSLLTVDRNIDNGADVL